MSSIDELPPDQRAALSLLLRQRKTHGEVAALLGIAPQAVHDRAHAALAVLAPAQARGLDSAQREEIGEYLLGQQSDAGARLRTRTLLSSSPAAAGWAGALAAQLQGLAPDGLPEIPGTGTEGGRDGAQNAADTPGAGGGGASEEHSRPSSRVGGALLLLAILAVAAVVVVFVTKGSSSHRHMATTGTSATRAKVEGRTTLHPQNPASPATGTVQILSEGDKRAFFIQAEHLPQTTGHTFYAIWLYNSPNNALALSKAPPVGASHKLAGAALLPANASSFREILLTHETSTRPSRPGPIVLRGPLRLSG